MIKTLFVLIFSFQILFSATLTDFETRQKIILDIKKVIQNEESIARAYEAYILKNYALPESINVFYDSDYLGTSVKFIEGIKNFTDNFEQFSISDNTISYALKKELKIDPSIKALYESDTYRKRTTYRNDKIYFTLEDSLSKHLYDLIKVTGSKLEICTGISNKNCFFNSHIYIKPTYASGTINNYLMAYHIDKFKTGPIVITDNTALHVTSEEFKTIPNGALLYDVTGSKYIKTSTGIEVLK